MQYPKNITLFFSHRVKYASSCTVTRTPVILTANRLDPVFLDNAFDMRMYVEKWKACPLLKDIPLKPMPVAIYDLMIDFNIVDIYGNHVMFNSLEANNV